jgi:hypothetical protein
MLRKLSPAHYRGQTSFKTGWAESLSAVFRAPERSVLKVREHRSARNAALEGQPSRVFKGIQSSSTAGSLI